MKITIIGSGNMGGAIAKGLSQGSIFQANDITCTAQTDETLEKMRHINEAFNLTHDNINAVREADIVVIAVKPWRVQSIIEEIRPALQFDKQIIVSIAAGVTFEQLNGFLTKTTTSKAHVNPVIFRVMPNTAIEVKSSMTFISAYNASQEQIDLLIRECYTNRRTPDGSRHSIGIKWHRIRLALHPRGYRRRRRIRILSQASPRNCCPYRKRSNRPAIGKQEQSGSRNR